MELVEELNTFLAVTDGDEHAIYNQHNGTDTLDHAVVLEIDDEAFGCGALRKKDDTSVEIKRMYVVPSVRGQRLGVRILRDLERKAKEDGYKRIVLETGIRQIAAIQLYEREGYKRIENYPPYTEMINSVCYEKVL